MARWLPLFAERHQPIADAGRFPRDASDAQCQSERRARLPIDPEQPHAAENHDARNRR